MANVGAYDREESARSNGNEPSNDGRDFSRVERDIAKCETLISLASTSGIECLKEDVQAVKDARSQVSSGKLTPEEQATFYCSMSKIVAAVRYPSRQISEDLQLCCEVVSHAARTGRSIEKNDLEALARARIAQRMLEWRHDIESCFYDAMGRISKSVAPAVAETAGSEAKAGARIAIRNYSVGVGILTALVLLLSCLMFIIRQISDDITKVIDRNDPLAVTMHNQLQSYAGAIDRADQTGTVDTLVQMQNSPEAIAIKESLQAFATNNRQLFSDVTRTRAITHFIFRIPNGLGHIVFREHWGEDWGGVSSRYGEDCLLNDIPPPLLAVPFNGSRYGFFVTPFFVPPDSGWQCTASSIRHALEIDLPIFALGETADKKKTIPQDAINQGFQKIAVYQDIRAMATYARDIILVTVGSITGFLLPVLYAWLGACASILRQLRSDTTACLFHPEYSKVANRAHVTTGVIVGISIGLFSNLLQTGTDISPLAIAFVAGYASDKFFEFIDRLVHAIFPSQSVPEQSEHQGQDGTKLTTLPTKKGFRRHRSMHFGKANRNRLTDAAT